MIIDKKENRIDCKECCGKGYHNIVNDIVVMRGNEFVWLKQGLGQHTWKCKVCGKMTHRGNARLYADDNSGSKRISALDTTCNDCKVKKNVCKHGSLARKCEVCELEEEVGELTDEDYIEGVKKGILMGYCLGCSLAYPLEDMNKQGLCEECQGGEEE